MSGSGAKPYDPRVYQNPHPEDADAAAAGAATGAAAAARWETKGGKAAKKGGGKGDADSEPCSNCGTLGATKKCR